MFRLLFKSVVVLLLVLGIGNYLVYLKTGQMPLRDMRERMGSDWLVDLREMLSPGQLAADAKGAVKDIADKVSEPETPAPTTVYKWTDANGQVHFGDKPSGHNAERIEVDTREALSAPEETPSQQALSKPSLSKPLLQQAEPESALDKARAAAEAMKQRVQQQEQIQ